jgi:hypothetical protein
MKTKVATKREIYEWIRAHHTQALDDIQCWEIAKWHVDRPGKETRAQLIERFERLDPPYNMPPARRRRWSHDARRQVYDRQGGRCRYCNCTLAPYGTYLPPHEDRRDLEEDTMWQIDNQSRVPHYYYPELDHLVPLTRGGSDTMDNLAYACKECNNLKRMCTAEEFAGADKEKLNDIRHLTNVASVVLRYERDGYTGFRAAWLFSGRFGYTQLERWGGPVWPLLKEP